MVDVARAGNDRKKNRGGIIAPGANAAFANFGGMVKKRKSSCAQAFRFFDNTP